MYRDHCRYMHLLQHVIYLDLIICKSNSVVFKYSYTFVLSNRSEQNNICLGILVCVFARNYPFYWRRNACCFHIIDMYYSIDVKMIKAIITHINAHMIVGSLNSHFKVELFENKLTRFSNRSYYMLIIIVESV